MTNAIADLETALLSRKRNPSSDSYTTRLLNAGEDEIVKKVRFPDWQHTSQGERLLQKELRRTLLKYKLHTDHELFDKAYSSIRE